MRTLPSRTCMTNCRREREYDRMIVLENIVKNETIVSADYYYPDDPSDKGSFVYDLENDRYISKNYNCVDEKTDGIYGFGKTADAVKRLDKYNKWPSTYRYIWY